jgi:hypothetical protein
MGFGTTDFDTEARFTNVGSNNNTTYTSTTYYTSPRTCYLQVLAQLILNDADFDDSDNYYIGIFVNGSIVKRTETTYPASATNPKVAPAINALVSVTAGDRISIGFRNETGGNVDPINTAGASWFQVFQVDL